MCCYTLLHFKTFLEEMESHYIALAHLELQHSSDPPTSAYPYHCGVSSHSQPIAGNFFTLMSILSVINVATLAFFWLMLAWPIFFHPFTFNLAIIYCYIWSKLLFESICLRYFFSYSANNCLNGLFRLFIINVIIDMLGCKTAILLILIFCLFFVFHFSVFFSAFLWVNLFFFRVPF